MSVNSGWRGGASLPKISHFSVLNPPPLAVAQVNKSILFPTFPNADLVSADTRSDLLPLRVVGQVTLGHGSGTNTAQREVCKHPLSLQDVTSS